MEIQSQIQIHIQCGVSIVGDSDGKESACSAGDLGLILGQEIPLEKAMATHSLILDSGIPWTKEPGGLWFYS